MKKLFMIGLFVIGTLFLTGCTTTSAGLVLPDLSGMTETEAISALSTLAVTVTIQTEENTEVETGIFSRYGSDLEAGDEVSPGAMLTLYFALNYPKLPDLSGQTSSQVRAALTSLGILFAISIETNNTVTDQTFSRYANPYSIGDSITNPSTIVTVYIGYNDPVLPDLSGKLIDEIENILNDNFIAFDIVYITNDNFAEDSFASYEGYNIGDFFSESRVTINLYKNTFTENATSLIISKYVDGGNFTSNQAIEIYNPTNIGVALKDYHLAIYLNASRTATYIIPFEDITLAPGATYVIVNSQANQALLGKANITSSNLVFDGNDCIQLQYKNNTYIDTIYNLGNNVFLMDDEVFIRSQDIAVGTREFDITTWVAYVPTYIEALGTHPVQKPSTIQFIFINRAFHDVLGGMDLVTVVYVNDGDTASFTPGFLNDKRVRFLGIDTPESYPVVQAWGLEAKAFTTAAINNATVIYIQSDVNSGFVDNYGRTLGLVWVDGVLLNYELVRLGYSHNYLGTDCKLVFENRYLYRWFQDAEIEAIANGLGIHS